MWLWTAIVSALLLGFYDVAKKKASQANDVLHILFYSTAISVLFFLPSLFCSFNDGGFLKDTVFYMNRGSGKDHLLIIVKSLIVTVSWISGLIGMQHLPITITGPIKASRPVFVIIFSIILFGERLNIVQWTGVVVSLTALFLLGCSSKKEGIDFIRNRWIFFMSISVVAGVVSALFDKYVMSWMNPVFVQGWCNIYITLIVFVVLMVFRFSGSRFYASFKWDPAILAISVFVVVSDFLYFFSLNQPDNMLSVTSLLRRSSVLVTFALGAFIFKETNLKAKGFEMILLLVGMAVLVLGSR